VNSPVSVLGKPPPPSNPIAPGDESLRALEQADLAASADVVARRLLGAYLVRSLEGAAPMVVRLVEVEAYLGDVDPGSHAYRGPTPRNHVMFGDAGRAYVYFTYGNHFMLNVVAGTAGRAAAVLLRGAEPLVGIEAMAALRSAGRRPARAPARGEGATPARAYVRWLLAGPARLAAALGVDRRDYGLAMVGGPAWPPPPGRAFRLTRGEPPAPEEVRVTGRIGLRQGGDLPLRFFVSGSAGVSAARPDPPPDA
jgi:DNA-3-methyladenine glycosylase